MSELETSTREYELGPEPAAISWLWIGFLAIILWGGAWWLAQR